MEMDFNAYLTQEKLLVSFLLTTASSKSKKCDSEWDKMSEKSVELTWDRTWPGHHDRIRVIRHHNQRNPHNRLYLKEKQEI